MKNFLNTKTIIGSLVVGLIGSALWENLFRDLLNLGGKTLLTISTLGLDKYKDNIYMSIAQGFYERVSIQILSLGLGVLFGIALGTIIITFKINKKDEKSKDLKIKKWLRGHKRFVKIGFLIYTIFVMGITVLSLAEITYINKSIAYYRQLESIAAPYITSDQEKIFNSRFSQIKNREGYTKLINELSVIIDEAGQTVVPAFIF
ncbi:MAG TPA: hypothetical protein ENH86_00405 [Candidatus Jorgensenbacteria bacterium]|nr:hypothetical protein [Candidatus Jorgensenbacteria bacterium]